MNRIKENHLWDWTFIQVENKIYYKIKNRIVGQLIDQRTASIGLTIGGSTLNPGDNYLLRVKRSIAVHMQTNHNGTEPVRAMSRINDIDAQTYWKVQGKLWLAVSTQIRKQIQGDIIGEINDKVYIKTLRSFLRIGQVFGKTP